MIEKYYKYKLDYKECIMFIKVGIFYECFDIDALIINKLFNYKLKKLSNIFKVGFPIKCIDSVTDKLHKENINYVIVGDNIIYKYISKLNKYNNYRIDNDNIFYNYLIIEKITNYLENNITNVSINSKLNEIVKILGI